MRVPGVRFTMRGLLILVALVAFLVWSARLWMLRQIYLEVAAGYAFRNAQVTGSPQSIVLWEDRWTSQRVGKPAEYPWPDGPPFVPAISKYYGAMQAKYERAARLPWLAVAPDPL